MSQKQELIDRLHAFRARLLGLRAEVSKLNSKCVNSKAIRDEADAIADMWVEVLRSPLEHRFGVDARVIQDTAADMKHLHVLSRPSNLKSSYLRLVTKVLRKFDDKFVLPVQQAALELERVLDLTKIVPTLPDPSESEYLKEAVDCAAQGHHRAAIVMGWCCAMDRMQRCILALGLPKFNGASTRMKALSKGKFKRWNKEFSLSTEAQLQEVFDSDLIVVLVGMNLLDGNQAERLDTCFQYRCHSAHPGEAPIGEPHVVAFFTDINSIVLQNPKFAIKP